jgi:hypothetical protein
MDANWVRIRDLKGLVLGFQSWNHDLSLHPVLVGQWAFGGGMHFHDATRTVVFARTAQGKQAFNRHVVRIQGCAHVVSVVEIHGRAGLDRGLRNF